jgi:hypothetical protein
MLMVLYVLPAVAAKISARIGPRKHVSANTADALGRMYCGMLGRWHHAQNEWHRHHV